MTATLAALEKGHEFSASTVELTSEWVAQYIAAVEDAAIAALGDTVPPMGVAALGIRALLEGAGLPDGAIHAGQEVAFHRAVRIGESLSVHAKVASRGERQGWVLMSVDLQVRGQSDDSVMTGRATVTFPTASSVEGVESIDGGDRAVASSTADGSRTLVKEITQEKISRYADASGDHNPLHIDPTFAARTRFGGTIAHGMLVLAYISELMEAECGQAWLAGGRLKVRFRGAARPGDTVTAIAIARDAERSSHTVECRNQREELLLSGTAEVSL